MTGVQKLEHAKLRVTDVDAALSFYEEVMGLVEISRDDGTVYLGTGYDEYYDLAIESGGTGIDHFAIRVPDEETLKEHEESLADADVETTWLDGGEPNQDTALRFDIPSGVTMEFMTIEKNEYIHVTDTPYADTSVGPVDLDHITLATPSPKTDAEFLRDVLGWNISDAAPDDSGDWQSAFTRYGDYHHDVGMLRADNPDWTLYHLGWFFQSLDHMKSFADALARHGHSLEMGINRHYFGDNLFAYFREPGGNRFEITAEMATVDDTTPTAFHTDESDRDNTIAAWGGCEFVGSMTDGM